MRALRDEAKVLQAEKAAKKAAFDAEYDVGGLLSDLQSLCCTLHCSVPVPLSACPLPALSIIASFCCQIIVVSADLSPGSVSCH